MHIICWLVFISYELWIVYALAGKLENLHAYVVYYLINISFFYGCLAILKTAFKVSRIDFLRGGLYFLLLLTFYLSLKGVADYWLDAQRLPSENPFIYPKRFYQRNLIRGLYFALLAIFYWSAGHISFLKKEKETVESKQILAEKENAELEAALAKTQNAYRQQQMNPHMLFNTLNFIYNQVQRHSEDAARCVWLLTEIMRFSMNSTESDGKIVLESEVEQIENMLEINSYRFQYPIFVDVHIDGEFRHNRIIPLILLTLTENVFKHGDLTQESDPAQINLSINENGRMHFATRNLKKAESAHLRNQHLGLNNVRIRLDAEYKDRYTLEIAETENEFELSLTMNL